MYNGSAHRSAANPYAAYDAMGNMVCRNTDSTSAHTCAGSSPTGATMTYDAHGQMASWSAPSGTVGSAHYLYDAEGNRVLTNLSNGGATSDTIYFDGYTETVITGGTTTTTKYYNATGARVGVRIGGSTIDYLMSDPLGSNSVALNDTGGVIAIQHYSPYGTRDYTWGTMPTSYNYAGQRLDSQTGLLYAHYVTRNRTHESDFSPFSFLDCEVPNIAPRCFRMRFWQREHIDLHHWMGTISRDVGLFGFGQSVCVTGRTPCPSDLLGRIWGTGSIKRAHAPLRLGTLMRRFALPSRMETWLFGGRMHE